jgi:hypothetical protein
MAVRSQLGRSRSATAALALAIGLIAGAAHAEPTASSPPVPESGVAAPDPAADAKRRGDDALVTGRHAEALAAYQEAVALRPDPALVYNIGRAHQGLGDYPAALDALETFERTAPPDVRARVPGLPVLLADVRKHVALVFVSSDVAGATVRLGARILGTTPMPAPVRVNLGSYTLFVEKDGYFPVERAATVGGGAGIVTFDGRLVSKTTQGIVTVRSSLAGAKVACDGKAEGTVPTEVVVAPGNHAIELTLDGYRPARTNVVVAAGERRSIDLALEAEAPITKKWWFWTGLGVLAAGATVVVIALSTERSPDTGSAGTGRINAGLRF